MRETTFTAAFTGQLSTIHGFSLPGTKLRVERGHRYRLTIDEQTGHGQLVDVTPRIDPDMQSVLDALGPAAHKIEPLYYAP